jgi:hypothetical protein
VSVKIVLGINFEIHQRFSDRASGTGEICRLHEQLLPSAVMATSDNFAPYPRPEKFPKRTFKL